MKKVLIICNAKKDKGDAFTFGHVTYDGSNVYNINIDIFKSSVIFPDNLPLKDDIRMSFRAREDSNFFNYADGARNDGAHTVSHGSTHFIIIELPIVLYDHCGSYLHERLQNSDVVRLMNTLDMSEEAYQARDNMSKRDDFYRFLHHAETAIVSGLRDYPRRYRRFLEMWKWSTDYDRTHGFPDSLYYQEEPEWFTETMSEPLPVK